jgi:hypothetical protein
MPEPEVGLAEKERHVLRMEGRHGRARLPRPRMDLRPRRRPARPRVLVGQVLERAIGRDDEEVDQPGIARDRRRGEGSGAARRARQTALLPGSGQGPAPPVIQGVVRPPEEHVQAAAAPRCDTGGGAPGAALRLPAGPRVGPVVAVEQHAVPAQGEDVHRAVGVGHGGGVGSQPTAQRCPRRPVLAVDPPRVPEPAVLAPHEHVCARLELGPAQGGRACPRLEGDRLVLRVPDPAGQIRGEQAEASLAGFDHRVERGQPGALGSVHQPAPVAVRPIGPLTVERAVVDGAARQPDGQVRGRGRTMMLLDDRAEGGRVLRQLL